MIIDCHLHTSRYSPCSNLSPYEACSLCVKRGIDAFVITEHQIQWNKKEIKELQQDFPKLKIYAGLEVTLKEGIDLVIITKNTGLNIPFKISFNELLNIDKLDIENSFIFVAHLFRWSTKIEKNVEKIFPHIHGIEMNSINILLNGHVIDSRGYFVPLDLPLYKEVQNRWGLPPLFNTDSHNPLSVGAISNKIKTSHLPEDEEELVHILKTSNPIEFQNIEVLKNVFKNL